MTGEGEGDDERIIMQMDKMPGKVRDEIEKYEMVDKLEIRMR